MHLSRFLLVLITAITAVSFPLQVRNSQENQLEHRKSHAGIIAGLSIAGLVGAALGLTEYATTAYARYMKGKLEEENKKKEEDFYADRVLIDNDFKNAGNDI